MQLVYKFDTNHYDRLCAICRVTNNLYNQALYIIRNELKDNDRWLFYPGLDRIMKNVTNLEGTVNYRLVKSHVAQQTLRVLDKAMKGYVKAVKDWSKNPGKYNGKPELPCYHKRGGMSNAIYTNQSCRIHDGYIILDRDLKIPVPQWEKYKDRIERFKQVRIIPKRTYMTVEVVYDCVCSDNVGTGMASIDLGVNNLVTLVCGCNALLFSGKVVKSYNRWFNKTLSMLQSIKDRQSIDKLTNRMRNMYDKRERFMNDVMHKTSRRIVDYLVSHHIGTLAVGYNKGWKQSVNMGGVNNQKFTFIPFARLRSCLRYKCELAGISYIEHEESYTSKCDALAMEDICKHDSYLGKRIKRGLFKSAVGKVINADVNGALNIGRKVFGDSFVIADSGRWYRPERINVLKCMCENVH